MFTKTKYVCEVSGKEFDDKDEAIAHELKMKDIKSTFAFLEPYEKLNYEQTQNGIPFEIPVYERIQDGIILMVNKYETWVADSYKKHGGLQRKHVHGGYIIARYLGDGNSPLYHYLHFLYCVCQKCNKLYDQPYNAIHCSCKK